MANFQRRHPERGPRDWMCKGYKALGNSRNKWWASPIHYNPPKAVRKAEASRETTADWGAASTPR